MSKIEQIIIDWLKNENENTTYLAHLIQCEIDNHTTQLSGLSDYELELEKIVDKIKTEPNILKCIKILEKYIKNDR